MIPTLSARRSWSAASLLCLLLWSTRAASAAATDDAAAAAAASKKCQTLHTSMTYSQDKAPRDISAVVSSFVCLLRCVLWIDLAAPYHIMRRICIARIP